ncbi:MAG: DNA starvation/stationary phase protection protein, partial [Bacteroidales bacterium]|nr:DNA starvation/stationary phase protection protein [Bacteroidales bacterium]MCI5720781.1 DNA starvation/stationary phase protection protein [Bacteroidales bacterium]
DVLKQASQIGDEVTVAIMSDWLKEQEKTSWMLVAFEKANCQK